MLASGAISAFCVEISNARMAISGLVEALESEFLEDAVLELITRYGKRGLMPGDVTVASFTVDQRKKRIDVSATRSSSGLVEWARSFVEERSTYSFYRR